MSAQAQVADRVESNMASVVLGARNWMVPQANAPAANLSRLDLPGPNPHFYPRELSLMSPVTPGETPQPSRGPVPPGTLDFPRATALPSPVPSTISPASPRADVIANPAPTQFPIGNERMTSQPLPSGPDQRATQCQGIGSPQTPVLETGIQHAVPSRSGSQGQNEALTVITDETWKQWSDQLDTLIADLSAKGALSGNTRESNVVWPRIDLLRQAISRKDCFYLVIHQLYCRSSIDPSTLRQIGAPKAGMLLLVPLLEDNSMMHEAAIFGFAHFPAPAQLLMQSKWYLQVLFTVPRFLSKLSTEWQSIWLQAPHPPLAANLWTKLALPSPILMSVMFMCVARRLHPETCIKPLLSLFWQDLESFRRCIDAGDPGTKQQALNMKLIQEYLKFPRLTGSTFQNPTSPSVAPRHLDTMPQTGSDTPPSHPNVSIAGSQRTNPPAPSPVGVPRGSYTSSSSPGLAPSPGPGASQDFGAQTQPRHPQSRYYNPAHPQGRGQWQQTYPPIQPMQPTQQIQQIRRQIALGQLPPQMLQIPQSVQPRQMQSATPMSPVPPNSQFAVNSQSQPATNPSPISTPVPIQSVTPIPHPMVHPISPRPQNHVNSQHSIAAQPSASVTLAPQVSDFQRLPNTPLLPPPGFRAPITVNPNPMRLGLHLADLRDPMKKLVKQDSDGTNMETDLFYYLDSFAVQPTIIDPEQPIYTWSFQLTLDETRKFPTVVKGKEGRPSVWTFKAGCRSYRLRCVRVPGTPSTLADRAWSVMGTHWPSVFYITVNGKELFVRRKVHNGKDLPLDITEHLQKGENSVQLDFILGQDECKTIKYAFGVEIMEVAEFDKILSLVQSIPAAESRAAILKRLSPAADDDLAVVTDNLTIGLVDPFMARIFDVPARSRNCRHPECFDRDTYIRTRKSETGQTPMVDNWRCPICRADARPQLLVVDEFLLEVHAELARTHKLDMAKAIQIKADGTWSLKLNSDEASPGAETHPSGSTAVKRKADSPSSSDQPSSRRKIESSGAHHSPAAHSEEPTIIELD